MGDEKQPCEGMCSVCGEGCYALLADAPPYVDCICDGCPRKVPQAWVSGMCGPCANEDCEHADGAKDRIADLETERDERRAELARLRTQVAALTASRDEAHAKYTAAIAANEEWHQEVIGLRDQLAAEKAGSLELRKRHGAREDETMFAFVERLSNEREGARVHVTLQRALVKHLTAQRDAYRAALEPTQENIEAIVRHIAETNGLWGDWGVTPDDVAFVLRAISTRIPGEPPTCPKCGSAAKPSTTVPGYSCGACGCVFRVRIPGTAGGDAAKPVDDERKYPCERCGVMRTKAEGGTVFTVCDECCWP